MKIRKHWLLGVALVASAGLVAAGCGGDDSSDSGGEPQKGGTLRLATQDFGWTNAFDPTGEYLGLAHAYYSSLIARTLVGYRHEPDVPGNELVPDIAESVPEPSDDGLTYTFTLKDGVKFGPPLSRAVTSKDIAFAFERIFTPSLVAQYANYYQNIEGTEEFKSGKAKSISGIQTPDDKTITFKLTKKQGNFLFAMAMPAASPMPREVAGCFTTAGDYGRYVVSSGPYMIEGSDKLDATSCKTLKPISGYNPTKSLTFVRNPDYDAASDNPEYRPNYADEISIVINTNAKDIFDKIEQGELDGSPDTPPADVIQKYATDDNLKENLKIYSGDRTWFITMNMAQPPFDDIHVRKAVNLVMDKTQLQKAWGGETAGKVATHIAPDTVYNGTFPADYDPYPFSESNAAEEMKQSKYDTDKDGVCDAAACKNVFFVSRNLPQWEAMNPIIEAQLKKLGIEVKTRALPTGNAYTTIQTVANKVPVAANPGWGKDFADAATFFVILDGRNILATGNTNYPLIGMTAAQSKEFGVTSPAGGIPSVDADIDACSVLSGEARTECFVKLDQKTMEEAVPWVPYLFANSVEVTGPAVTNYVFDQYPGEMAFGKIAVDPSKQK